MTKLIAVDMDGTFLNSEKTYNKKIFQEIYQKLQNQGIRFVVASGNQYFQLKDFFPDFPDIIYVAENGAIIRDQKKFYNLHVYKPEAVKALEDFLVTLLPEINFLMCGVESAYGLDILDPDFMKMSANFYHHLASIKDFSEIDDQIVKVGLSCPPEKTEYYINLFKEKLSDYCDVTSSGHGDIDLIQSGIHKANGLKELGNDLGISLDEMTAFGDGGNDLEMLTEVGDGVAMANAMPQVLKIANHITNSNDEDGVLNYIEKNILK